MSILGTYSSIISDWNIGGRSTYTRRLSHVAQTLMSVYSSEENVNFMLARACTCECAQIEETVY